MAALRLSIAGWLDQEGSTRAVGLLRIALAGIALVRYADELAFYALDDWRHGVLAAFFFVLVPLMFIGLATRIVVPLVGATLALMYFSPLLPLHYGWNQHHAYLLMVSVMLLSLTSCGASYSLDRFRGVLRAKRKGIQPPPEHGTLWGARLMGLQLSALYFWTAFDKTNIAFLSGERLEQIMLWHHSGRPLEFLWQDPAVLASLSVAVVVLEYALAVAIHVPRWQAPAITVAIGFHALLYVLVPVSTFSVTMIALFIVVLPPEAIDRFTRTLETEPDGC